MGDDGDRAVVGHVEPLVRVDRPRVGEVDASSEVAGAGRRGRPQAKRAVNMQPGVMGRACVGDGVERVECACGDVACLRADDRRAAAVGQGVAQRVGVHAALVVGA